MKRLKTKLTTFKLLKFYLSTKSPITSKMRVALWFLVRLPLRIFLDFGMMKKIIKNLESWRIISKMNDDSLFYNSIEQISNLYEIYSEEKHEKLPNEIKRKLSPRTIIDVGAHIGIFSIKWSKRFPNSKIYSIEPEETNFQMLKINKGLNKLKNIFLFKLALLDKEDYVYIHLDAFGSGQHSIFRKSLKKEKIKATTLDKFRKIIERKIDLIKIDTEGSEFKILLGSKKCIVQDKPVLIIETHPWYDPKIDQKIIDFLKKLNYKIKVEKNEGSTIFAWC